MANLPFGMNLQEGAPMSELTRRVLKNMLATKKIHPDAAKNKNSFYNASNIKPVGAHGPGSMPMDNAKHYDSEDSKVKDSHVCEGKGMPWDSKTKEDKLQDLQNGRNFDRLTYPIDVLKTKLGLADEKTAKKVARVTALSKARRKTVQEEVEIEESLCNKAKRFYDKVSGNQSKRILDKNDHALNVNLDQLDADPGNKDLLKRRSSLNRRWMDQKYGLKNGLGYTSDYLTGKGKK